MCCWIRGHTWEKKGATERRGRRLFTAILLSFATISVLAFLWTKYLHAKPSLNVLLRSGRYTIVAAEDVEVRLQTPNYGALVHNLNTVVLKKPQILNSASATLPSEPSPVSGFILTSPGDGFAIRAKLAITAREEDDAILKDRGIVAQGEGIPAILLPPAQEVDIYQLDPDGRMTFRQHVSTTHLLIK